MTGWGGRVLLVSITQLAMIVPFVMAQSLGPAPAPTSSGMPPGMPMPPPPPARQSPGPPSPVFPPPAREPPGPPGAVAGADLGGSKSNVGAIVGGVVGGILATILVVLGVLLFILKLKANERAALANGDKTLPTEHAPPTNPAPHAPGVPAARPTPLPKPDVEVLNAKVPAALRPAPRPVPVAAPHMVNRPNAAAQQDIAYNMDVQRYSYEEVLAISSNWAYKLGEGGFGTVYYGQIFSDTAPGEPNAGPQLVALKRLSATSQQQGKNAFLNEVRLLSRIHYRYLVSLVGFCDETNNQVLIYEYVHEGSLADWLHGANQGHPGFNWYYRLLIALHAALGLDYLHVGARPNIIHRDVKSSNILITKEWEGRVADFGLSKTGIISEDQQRAHLTTLVRGTPGYIDPEYFRTAQLTTKSDVYSFGIVLLELVTGRLPIDHSQVDPQIRLIENFVQSHYPRNLAAIADPNLNGNYDMRSMRKIVNVALRSVALQGANRPTMSDVVGEIRSAIKLTESPAAEDSTYNTQDFLTEVVAEISKTPAAPILPGAHEPGRPRSGPSNNKHHRRSSTGGPSLLSSNSQSTGSSSASSIPSSVAIPTKIESLG